MLTTRRPYRITLSVYGASEESYDALTRRRGAFRPFTKGLDAAHEAGLPINLSLVVTHHNEHEVDAMRVMADRYGVPYAVYSNISPTIHSGAETLPSQSAKFLRERKLFTGCGAGYTHFHVDPHGNASICKVGRDPNVPLPPRGRGRASTRRDRRLADGAHRWVLGVHPVRVVLHVPSAGEALSRGQFALDRYCQHGRG